MSAIAADRSGRFDVALRKPGKLYQNGGKRLFDLVMAVLTLPIIAPVVFILWAFVRADGGPGFYSQTRIGVGGREFRCWKLRTMIMDADTVLREMCDADPELAQEWHRNQKLANDPRITKIGRFLRASSLDELPQIWNILLGDMSFVGPRPFMDDQDFLYVAAGGRAYYTVRPGITGPWQVFGRGETSFTDRVKYDTFYCDKLTLKSDLFYIWKTVGVVVRRTGS
ncbi:Sugar transferase involved in LPS biosynthesis (colanic, teichoic acid) [Celeribacter neptunius]|uniref:Sugar transferase involved in LPS biosynthesis (Colanic, teichoic acid) n=2 Tax=Celeribacter neptunius TaxID=588602 RepID=A0A1I3SFY8_9RHOB|nr:Sugar transferase involved in LPS biosynthesis (colanic, teichoic acid) [Celeribacter neptunius]